MKTPMILTVSQLNTYAKSILEEDTHLANVYLSGEISNFSAHVSGHFYFSLKDDSALIRTVMFKTASARVKFLPQNGMSVVARGRVSLYERDGQYQFYVQDIVPDGLGALHVAFEQLKERLSGEGLFDPKRKKFLPQYPSAIAVITAPGGAALQDILIVLGRRYPVAQVNIYPVKVGGDGAAPELISAVEQVNLKKRDDVIIIGRGGGSLEELWAFNDERLARTVAASEIPVVSAVGHETDFTICDFAADLRAPTPSAAAELAVPDRFELLQYIGNMQNLIKNKMYITLKHKRFALNALLANPLWRAPASLVEHRRERLSAAQKSLRFYVQEMLKTKSQALALVCTSLSALSPLNVLARGYSVTKREGKVITHAQQVKPGDSVEITLSNGQIIAKAIEIMGREG